MRRRHLGGWVVLVVAAATVRGADSPVPEAGRVAPPPRVAIAFNRVYDYPELVEALRALVRANPELLTIASLGKSVEGRDLWCVTVNNPKTGPDRAKPAMYVDGNVHGNEVQGSEACLYLIWWLTENRDRSETLKRLTDERAFYVVPTVNPDGRAYWFNGPNTTHSARGGKGPLDNDRDGLIDEDGYDDLNGDGQITQMRRKNPKGRYKVSPEDPRLLVLARPDEEGSYDLLGMEGIDNDGDGLLNEDPPGGYDMNRNFPADWQPEHLQTGAGDYPLCWPETRAVARFVLDHANIAGVQSFHNAAGMILRGPGHPARQAEYPAEDDRVADEIGRTGARMLPFYRSLVIHKDLYNLHGGFVTWTYEHLGIFSFTNELWNNDQLLGKTDLPGGSSLGRAVGGSNEADQLFVNDRLLLGLQFVPWTAVQHPLYGAIEVGGFVKQAQRVPPSFLIEEMCHRNAAFVLHHADQMPRLVWDEVKAEKLGPDVFAVTASARNTRSIPSVARQAANRRIGLPDTFNLSGAGLAIAGGGLLVDPDTGEVQPADNPATLRIDRGISGGATVRARWFVRGRGVATVRYRSQKGGTLTQTVELK